MRHKPTFREAALVLTALGFAFAVAPLPAQQAATKQLTVERIYSAPSLSGYLLDGIEWSPDGKRVSYFQGDGRGGRALWETDAATGKRSVLVKAETLRAAFPAEKTSAIQSTGLGRIDACNLFLVARWQRAASRRRQQPRAAGSENNGVEAAGQRRRRNRRSQIFSRWQVGQLRPRLKSLGCECRNR